MKPGLKTSISALLVGITLFLSCKKDIGLLELTNHPPLAKAGPDQIITLPKERIFLDGSASNDPEDNISNYQWSNISSPVSLPISNPFASRTFVKVSIKGAYQFELKVTDKGGLSTSDTVQILVNDPFPVAKAGPDQTITLPLNSTYLDGSRSFPNGLLDSMATIYEWRKISGPSQYVLNLPSIQQALQFNSFAPTTAILKDLIPGVYIFKLQVTSSAGSDSDTIQINVVNDPQNANTITYHDLTWEGNDIYASGIPGIVLISSIQPDLFYDGYSTRPLEVYLKLNSSWTLIPYARNNTLYTYDVSQFLLWINNWSRNIEVIGQKTDIKIKLL